MRGIGRGAAALAVLLAMLLSGGCAEKEELLNLQSAELDGRYAIL